MKMHAQRIAPITAVQVKKIHALKNAMDIDDDLYRFILGDMFQVASSKELDKHQAGRLIEEMEAKAVELGRWERRPDKRERFRNLARRAGMASPEQLRKIEAMWSEVSRVPQPEERTKALRHFIERVAKVSDLRFLDIEGAGKVLNALKAMQSRAGEAGKGKARQKAL